MTMDNYGKMWFQAGASGMPGYFQMPVRYGDFTYPEQFEPELNTIWGAPVLIADMQGGMHAVRCRTVRSSAPPVPPATTCSAAIACPRT